MNWILLVLAGLFEIGWPVGLKIAQAPETRWTGVAMAAIFMAFSGTLRWLAQRTIPIGTAYGVWTWTGAAGTFLVGAVVFGDATSLLRYSWIALIIAGIVALKFGT